MWPDHATFVIPVKTGHVVKHFALPRHFNAFWTQAFAGVTELGLFTRPSRFKANPKKLHLEIPLKYGNRSQVQGSTFRVKDK